MIFDRFDPTAYSQATIRNERISGWAENYSAAQRAFEYVDGGQASGAILRDLWEPMVDQINEISGTDFYAPSDWLNVGIGISATQGHNEQMYTWQANQIMSHVKAIEAETPGTFPQDILSLMDHKALEERTILEAQTALRDYESTIANSEGFWSSVARFTGGLTAGATDPSNVPYMMMGGGGKNLYSLAFREALANAAGEAVLQPSIANWYEQIGEEYTWKNFAVNVGSAGFFGGALPVVARGVKVGGAAALTAGEKALAPNRAAARVVSSFLENEQPRIERMMTPDQMREGVFTLQQSGIRMTTDGNTAFTIAEDIRDIENSNPGTSQTQHVDMLSRAEVDVANGRIPNVSGVERGIVNPELIASEADNLDGFIFKFNPRDIGVDAETFQFKLGGDEYGVTDRLRGVKEWDPILAGEILVYEYADGRIVIADGHQRLGLAKRISDETGQELTIYGRKLREVDGVSPEDAMVIAAIKNIAEGTGTAIDAAKIARMDPSGFASMIGRTLPPSSTLVRQANDMAALTDEAFGAIYNEVIPSLHGAVIGRVLGDRPELQMTAVGILAKTQPSNTFQAEAIVRQIREADTETVSQMTLFGEETMTESLFVERAAVLDRAYKQLKQDKATFASLTRNADRIEAEGANTLDRAMNEQRATQDAQMIALLQTLANRKGPVSDALSQAARTVRETGSYGRATREFVDSVRGSIEAGDLDRLSSGDIGRAVYDPPESSRNTIGDEPSLEGFDEPNGTAADQQVDQLTRDMFGEPEAVTPPSPREVASEIISQRFGADSDRSMVYLPDLFDASSRALQGQLKARQPFENTGEELLAHMAPLHEELNSWAADVAARNGMEFNPAPLKELKKVNDKVNSKYDGDYRSLADAARTGITAHTIDEADAFVAGLAERFHLIDEGWIVTPAGYFDRKLMVVFDDGSLGEVQIWPPKMLEAKETPSKFGPSGHDLYNLWANPKTDPSVRADAEAKMKEIYGAVAAKLDPSFAEKLGLDAPAPASKSSTLSSGISTARSSESTARAKASEGVAQELPLSNAPTEPSIAPISPKSNIKNRIVSSYETQAEITPAGEQTLMPGVEPITQRQRLEAQAQKPMTGGKAAMPIGSLFDETARLQKDLFADFQDIDTISVGVRQDAEGNLISEEMTMAEIKSMLEAEDDFITQLGICAV